MYDVASLEILALQSHTSTEIQPPVLSNIPKCIKFGEFGVGRHPWQCELEAPEGLAQHPVGTMRALERGLKLYNGNRGNVKVNGPRQKTLKKS